MNDPSKHQEQHQSDTDLLYLRILKDAVTDTTEPCQFPDPSSTISEFANSKNSASRNFRSSRVPQLDNVINDFLAKKGVFDLPPTPQLWDCCLDALVNMSDWQTNRDILIKIYFDHVHPFAPVVNRVDFLNRYQSGDFSLLLLWSMLTSASIYASAELLSSCGFVDRSAAQESFFFRAKLLHDFAVAETPLLMLQGSIILASVILDHPSDWDFEYWLHNAIRLANKIDLHNV